MRYVFEKSISAPTPLCFKTFTEFDRYQDRLSGVTSVEVLTDGDNGKGTLFEEVRCLYLGSSGVCYCAKSCVRNQTPDCASAIALVLAGNSQLLSPLHQLLLLNHILVALQTRMVAAGRGQPPRKESTYYTLTAYQANKQFALESRSYGFTYTTVFDFFDNGSITNLRVTSTAWPATVLAYPLLPVLFLFSSWLKDDVSLRVDQLADAAEVESEAKKRSTPAPMGQGSPG
jgi:hypothetical protein